MTADWWQQFKTFFSTFDDNLSCGSIVEDKQCNKRLYHYHYNYSHNNVAVYRIVSQNDKTILLFCSSIL